MGIFDEMIRKLKNLDGQKLSFDVQPDKEGYFERECPSDKCRFQFKVHAEDWKDLFRDEAVYCPLCRHETTSDQWWTTEQIENAKWQALEFVEGEIGEAARKDARNFNAAQSRDGFITMSLEVKGIRGRRALVPIPSKEPMELCITCDRCQARFAVIGSAFFCPCCGHNSADRTFDDTLRKTLLKIDVANQLADHLDGLGKNEAEILKRSMIETALADCVVAIQRLAEQLYSALPIAPEPGRNVFQRIDEASELWRAACAEGYEDWLDGPELSDLKLLFQRRHLLLHTDGIVDQAYLDRSGDTDYQLGQRIVVSPSDVRRLVHLVKKLADNMRRVSRGA